jgi:glycosyltransferase involved in cell wall biosynthesis
MSTSFVIPAFNEEREIGACLESILRYAQGRASEIIVVDNASTDRTAEIARGYPEVRVVSEQRKGTGYARQCGLQEASGDLVAFIDADVRLRAGWLDRMERVFDRRPGVVAVSGPYLFHDGPRWLRWVIAAGGYAGQLAGHHLFGAFIVGGNFVARRQALEAMGGFDQTINLFGDDSDIARRIKQQGKVLFRSDVFVYSSTRRFAAEGLFMPTVKYLLNYYWIFLFHRPLFTRHDDVR